jgi:outer membrane protein OmpA-like peptidoglycan-associated protein/Tol biopolymer transport system component
MRKVLLAMALSYFGHDLTAQTKSNLIPLGSPINTKEYREYAFSISGDGKTFVFAQDRQEGTKLYVCTRPDKNSAWSSPQAIENINALLKGRISGTSLTFDGKELFFDATIENGLGETDIYYTKRMGNEWAQPQNVGEPLNTAMYEGSPSISPDGKTLFFVREKFEKYKDVEPCYVIWVATRNDEGWGGFEKIGEPINSDCEKAPMLMADGRTLIFSSIRGGGMGGFDLYQTEVQEDGSWTYPKELDFINTSANEAYTAVSGNNEEIYVEIKGDIYKTTLPNQYRGARQIPVNLNIVDALTKKPIDAKIFAALNSRNSAQFFAKNGSSQIQLKAGNNYLLACEAPGYLPANQIKISLENSVEGETVSNTVEMMPTMMNYQIKAITSDGTPINNPKIRIFDLRNNQLVSLDPSNSAKLLFGNVYALSITGQGGEYTGNLIPDIADAPDNFIKTIKLDTKLNSAVAISKAADNPYTKAPEIDMSKPTETFKLKSDPTIVYETKKIYTFNDVYFDRNSVVVKSEYYIDINRLIELLALNPKLNVQLAGYSDSAGDARYNMIFSEKRAKACADYLRRAGIDLKRILVKGFGEADLVYTATGKEDTSKSRRVRFIVY